MIVSKVKVRKQIHRDGYIYKYIYIYIYIHIYIYIYIYDTNQAGSKRLVINPSIGSGISLRAEPTGLREG